MAPRHEKSLVVPWDVNSFDSRTYCGLDLNEIKVEDLADETQEVVFNEITRMYISRASFAKGIQGWKNLIDQSSTVPEPSSFKATLESWKLDPSSYNLLTVNTKFKREVELVPKDNSSVGQLRRSFDILESEAAVPNPKRKELQNLTLK